MGITTNGFPKAGNHALMKAVELLGFPCRVDHFEFGQAVEEKHIFIKRDPRNIVCSWMKFYGKPMTPGMFITNFRQFQAGSLVEDMRLFEGWLWDASTLVVKYEDLIASSYEMRRIAAYLGTPYIDGAFEELPGLTMTWNFPHSDYQTIWTDEVKAVWESEGGTQLLSRWGY